MKAAIESRFAEPDIFADKIHLENNRMKPLAWENSSEPVVFLENREFWTIYC